MPRAGLEPNRSDRKPQAARAVALYRFDFIRAPSPPYPAPFRALPLKTAPARHIDGTWKRGKATPATSEEGERLREPDQVRPRLSLAQQVPASPSPCPRLPLAQQVLNSPNPRHGAEREAAPSNDPHTV